MLRVIHNRVVEWFAPDFRTSALTIPGVYSGMYSAYSGSDSTLEWCRLPTQLWVTIGAAKFDGDDATILCKFGVWNLRTWVIDQRVTYIFSRNLWKFQKVLSKVSEDRSHKKTAELFYEVGVIKMSFPSTTTCFINYLLKIFT